MEIHFNSRDFLSGKIKPFKLGVIGSRTLKDERVKLIIMEKIKELGATKIITAQEPQGVCEVAQAVAKEFGYPLELHFLNYRYLRGMFEQRSKELVEAADYFIVIHDGKSQGTSNEKKLVQKSGKPFMYYELEPTEHQRSVGFNVTKEWDINKENDDWQLEM